MSEPVTKIGGYTFNPSAVEPLGTPATARQITASASSTNVALTAGVNRISILANGGAIRYAIGSGAQTATTASHFIASGERLDIKLPVDANIAVRLAGATASILEVSELI